MKIYLATWLEEPAQGTVLTAKGALRRLLSFWHLLKGKTVSRVRAYCENRQ